MWVGHRTRGGLYVSLCTQADGRVCTLCHLCTVVLVQGDVSVYAFAGACVCMCRGGCVTLRVARSVAVHMVHVSTWACLDGRAHVKALMLTGHT